MTLIVVLLFGLGTVLIISSLEDVSVVQTIKDIWNNKPVTLTQPPAANGGGSAGPFAFPNPNGGATIPLTYQQAVIASHIQSQQV